MIKALIFDMDDTLINSSPLQKKSLGVVLKKYGMNIKKVPKKIESKFFGKRMIEITKIILDYFNSNISPKKILNEREKLYIKMLKKVEPMPKLKEVLEYLRDSNYKIAIATSSNRKYVKIVLSRFKMEDIFKIIVSEEEVKNAKPNPDLYLLALKKLKIKKENVIVIEDSRNGIIAAKRAGIKTIAVKNIKFKTNQDLTKASYIINNLGEIKDVLALH